MVGETLLVVSKGGHQDIEDHMLIKFKLNLGLANDMNKDIEMGGGESRASEESMELLLWSSLSAWRV
jgi:hypothetical protein